MSVRKTMPCTIMRGGTSKGVFFLRDNMPGNMEDWDPILLKIMGSPDKKQINGLGGATSVTSKIAIISASSRPDADVDYTFAQVSVDKAIVSYKGNCGNISSAVGPFAIEKGLVPCTEPVTTVRIYNTNTDKVIVSEVQVENGQVRYDGDLAIAGVPETAVPVKLSFLEPAGAVTGSLLPTGNVRDTLDVPGLGQVQVSIVDASNPLVFMNVTYLGEDFDIFSPELGNDEVMLELIETIRGLAACRLGLIEDYRESAVKTPGVPKMTLVSEARDYKTTDGQLIKKQEIDFLGRMMSMQKPHPSYAMTGAICTAAAAKVPGSVVNQLLQKDQDVSLIRIGNPAGIIPAGVDAVEDENEILKVRSAYGFRTANYLMDGVAYYNI